MRLFPLVPRLPKFAAVDSTLPMIAHGQKTSVFVPKGSYLILDVMAVHTHRMYPSLVIEELLSDCEGRKFQRDIGDRMRRNSSLNDSLIQRITHGRGKLVRLFSFP